MEITIAEVAAVIVLLFITIVL